MTGVLLAATLSPRRAAAELPAHDAVAGAEITTVDVQEPTAAGAAPAWRRTGWEELAKGTRAPGVYRVRVDVPLEASAVEIPVCAGRGRISVDGAPFAPAASAASAGPVVVPLAKAAAHVVSFEVNVGKYERRIACGAAPRAGAVRPSRAGLGTLTFESPPPARARGGGRAVVYVPANDDGVTPRPVLVGAHPWDGSMWTYAAYAELLREADARGVVLLMPSGLGNSLYTADAEDEVMRALDALEAAVKLDRARVSIWGASMGGAGATTIAFHRPDRFAAVTSFFGDSKYDMTTYVRSILRDEAGAHLVNALDVVESARHLDVWLVHGEADRVSPIAQSAMLARALEARKMTVRFDRVPEAGHEGALVARFAREMVARAANARAPSRPARVSFWSLRAGDTEAYGVRIVRSGGDAFVDVEATTGGLVLHAARGVKEIVLSAGALGFACPSDQSALSFASCNGCRREPSAGVSIRCQASPGTRGAPR